MRCFGLAETADSSRAAVIVDIADRVRPSADTTTPARGFVALVRPI